MSVMLAEGDATFVTQFHKIGFGDSGQKYTFGFKPPRGQRFVVMLIGVADKDATDFDCEKALNDLGFFRREDDSE